MTTISRSSALLALLATAISAACSNGKSDGEGGSGGASTQATTGATTTATQTAGTGTSGSAVTATAGTGTGTGTGTGAGGAPTIRRPFLVGASMRSAEAATRRDWLSPAIDDALDDAHDVTLDAPTRGMLASVWLQDAREEHASVAAFARFTMLMMSVGAPPDMIRDSQRASLDEIEHAKACFALARRYGSGDVGPAGLDLTASLGAMSLVDIAALTAEEGCVGETLGVALAMEQERVVDDPVVRKLLRRLIKDEQRHAELAWAFVAWAVERGGTPVREAVVGTIERAIRETLEAPIRSYEGIDLGAWRRHGRLTCLEAREVAREAATLVVMPAMALLGPPRGPTSRQQRSA